LTWILGKLDAIRNEWHPWDPLRTIITSENGGITMSSEWMISAMSPSPIGMVLQTTPIRMIRLGETLESMRSYIGVPVGKGSANQWGGQTGAVEIYCYEGGGVFKVRTALVFLDGTLTAFADWTA
jgi:hypothetical protein